MVYLNFETPRKSLAGGGSIYMSKIGSIYLSAIVQYRGNHKEAIKYYKESLEIDEKLGNEKDISNSLHQIGSLYHDIKKEDEAIIYHQRALEIREKIGDRLGVSYSLNQIGLVFHKKGDLPKALKYYKKSMRIKKELKDRRGMSNSLLNIGNIYLFRNKKNKALENYNDAARISEEIGDSVGKARCYFQIGQVYFNNELYMNSLSYFLESYKIFKRNKMESAKAPEEFIFKIKSIIPKDQFESFLKCSRITTHDTFDREDNLANSAIEIIIKITTDAIIDFRGGINETQKSIVKLNKLLDMFPKDREEGEWLKAYIHMLLDFIKGKDYKKHQDKIPDSLIQLFEKIIDEVEEKQNNIKK
jgi:tetratricopeptide (TPR) repeat protein